MLLELEEVQQDLQLVQILVQPGRPQMLAMIVMLRLLELHLLRSLKTKMTN
jgi:hypothetical protein